MGEDCGTWHPQLHFNWQSPFLNSSGATLDLERSAYMNPSTNMISTNDAFRGFPLSEAPNLWAGHPNEPNGWFYCWPRFRQAFTPVPTSLVNEKLPAFCNESCKEILKPNVEPESAQKRFLVVDQSGNQTTLIFSSGVGASVRCLASWKRNSSNACNLCTEDGGTERVLKNLSDPVLTDEFNDDNENDGETEMHEDTEELDALLYSDDEGYGNSTEDEEVTSTGHSPSTVTSYDRQDWFGKSTDEVASSVGTTKKRKLFDGDYDDKPFLMDIASSVKRNRSMELEDDAESSCANAKSYGLREIDFLSSNKTIRKEKIRETVGVLQSIIPDSKGKDAIVVLEEAIEYLKYLKLKAKAFGIDAV